MSTLKNAIDGHEKARCVVALIRAGKSQESGLPTCRSGVDNLRSEFVVGEFVTAQAQRTDPAMIWSWLQAMALKIGLHTHSPIDLPDFFRLGSLWCDLMDCHQFCYDPTTKNRVKTNSWTDKKRPDMTFVHGRDAS